MRRYRRRSPQPHIEPEVPHPQALSHRAVLHVRRHTADPRGGGGAVSRRKPAGEHTHQRTTERRRRTQQALHGRGHRAGSGQRTASAQLYRKKSCTKPRDRLNSQPGRRKVSDSFVYFLNFVLLFLNDFFFFKLNH